MTTQLYADRPLTAEQFKELRPGIRVWVQPYQVWATVHGYPDAYAMQVKVQFERLSKQIGTFCCGDLWEAPPLPADVEKDIFRVTMGGPVFMSHYTADVADLSVQTIRQLQKYLLAQVGKWETVIATKLKDDPDRMVYNIAAHDFRVEHVVRDPNGDTEPGDNFDVAVMAGFITCVEAGVFGNEHVEPMGRHFDLTELD